MTRRRAAIGAIALASLATVLGCSPAEVGKTQEAIELAPYESDLSEFDPNNASTNNDCLEHAHCGPDRHCKKWNLPCRHRPNAMQVRAEGCVHLPGGAAILERDSLMGSYQWQGPVTLDIPPRFRNLFKLTIEAAIGCRADECIEGMTARVSNQPGGGLPTSTNQVPRATWVPACAVGLGLNTSLKGQSLARIRTRHTAHTDSSLAILALARTSARAESARPTPSAPHPLTATWGRSVSMKNASHHLATARVSARRSTTIAMPPKYGRYVCCREKGAPSDTEASCQLEDQCEVSCSGLQGIAAECGKDEICCIDEKSGEGTCKTECETCGCEDKVLVDKPGGPGPCTLDEDLHRQAGIPLCELESQCSDETPSSGGDPPGPKDNPTIPSPNGRTRSTEQNDAQQ